MPFMCFVCVFLLNRPCPLLPTSPHAVDSGQDDWLFKG